MELDMSDAGLPEDYLSPRTKVARMLADIDDGPTPSPSPLKRTGENSLLNDKPQAQAEDPSSLQLHKHHSSPVSVDEDGSSTRPIGRAARRMLIQDHDSDGDLYSATPAKPQRTSHVTPARRTLSRSPGLFVSPAMSEDSDDLPDNPLSRPSRLAELVAAKRNERIARENATERRSLDPSMSPARVSSDLPDEIIEDATGAAQDSNLEKILSDAARPTRKASKKAMLDMERETQRLAREQALAHQMKTKKKFTNTDLFARLNFRQPSRQQEPNPSSSAPNSDGAEAEMAREPLSTPPSSPPTPWDTQKAMVERGALARMVPAREDSIASLASMALVDADDDDAFPEIHDLVRQSQSAKATAQRIASQSPSRTAPVSRMRNKLRQLEVEHEDSDEDIDIIQPMPTHLKVFDRVKPVSKRGEVHSKAIHALKHLAHLNHDNATARGKRALKPVIPTTAVNAQLIATAKAQARQAQQERLAELKAKGIVVMSIEEQEKEHDQFENLLEKARQEAEDIRKQEKAARRKQGDESKVLASDDESEDEDWQESGSEKSAAEDSENELLDDAAAEDESIHDNEDLEDEDDAVLEDESAQDDVLAFDNNAETPAAVRPIRKSRIIIEDDEEDVDPSTAVPDEDPFAAFGFDSSNAPDLMSPTQAFAATMQTPSQWTQGSTNARHHSSTYGQPPPATFGQLTSQDILDEGESQLVPASQLQQHTQAINLDWETQLPETPNAEAKSASMMETPGWEPSQDAGLPSPWTAARRGLYMAADDDHETQSTVPVRVSESPEAEVPRKRARLTRGVRVADSDDEETFAPVKKGKNAFIEMQQRRMESMNATDRAAAEKEMKNMMDDQAEESEDEYAGLGGDDSNMIAPENDEDRAAIDDSKIEINEHAMQKFYADRQRAAEEEATSKLFKDITTGALRRRQGVGWELDEDEDDLAARRRQIRQREEARKRRLLLQDDNVKGLLEGRGNSKGREAFLRTIGDDDNQDELFEPMEAAAEDIQQDSQSHDSALREISNNKRRLELSQGDMPQAKIRRTREDEGAFSRPTSMLQVRESLSFLLDEPVQTIIEPVVTEEEITFDSQCDDDDPVEEESSRENDGGYAPDLVRVQSQDMPPPPLPTDRLPAAQRRTPAAVIDRLSLRRGSSSSSSTSSMGWNAWSTGSTTTSKTPSLLRRATSNLSASSTTNERGVSYVSAGAGANDRGVSVGGGARMGGSKKSSLAYQSRAHERKAIGERAERKKEENRRKVAEIRRQQGGALVNGIKSGQWE